MRGDLRNTARHWSPGAFQPPGGFCDVGCCCYFFWPRGGFYVSGLLFHAIGTPTRLLRPPPALSSTLATFGCFTFANFFRLFIFTASATVLSEYFLPTVLPYTLLFVTEVRAERSHSRSSPVPALTELSLRADAWTWTVYVWITRLLIYQLRQWATKHRVKIELLNISCI